MGLNSDILTKLASISGNKVGHQGCNALGFNFINSCRQDSARNLTLLDFIPDPGVPPSASLASLSEEGAEERPPRRIAGGRYRLVGERAGSNGGRGSLDREMVSASHPNVNNVCREGNRRE